MKIIGCDFHPSYQQIAVLDSVTGEMVEKALSHERKEEVRAFYAALEGSVRVGIEASGQSQWFERMLAELGHEVWIGDAAKIRASCERKRMTADRTRDKMHQRAQKGLWNGGHAPYRYRAEHKRLVVTTGEAVRVRFMFERFANAPSLARLREELQQRGWNTRSNGRWSKTAIDQILRNPIYCGLIRFNEQRFKGEHEALIDEDLFKQVQSVRRDRSHGVTRMSRVFLLRGLVRCSECGSSMTPHYTQKKHKDGSVYRIPYYRCTRTMHFDNSVCSVKHINADHVEQAVIGKLSDLSQNEAYLKMTVDELNGDCQRKVAPLEKEVDRIKSRLKEIEQEIGRYVKALGQGRISIGRLETEIASLEANKEALQRERGDLERKINESASRDFKAELLQRNLRDFRATFSALTAPEQSEALQCILKGVVVHRSKLQMEVFELEEFQTSSQKRKVWLPGEDSNLQHFG